MATMLPIAEAMACGLPAIATDYPGVRAVIDEGENGLLVPRGDPDAVAVTVRPVNEWRETWSG